MSHYFKNDPNLQSNLKTFDVTYNGKQYRFFTDDGVFSKDYIDFGTYSLIKAISLPEYPLRYLDLGCGYGPIGIILKSEFPHIEMIQADINLRAVELTEKNIELNKVSSTIIHSDGFSNIYHTFDIITLNPPIRAGKEAIYELYKGAHEHLSVGGVFYIVIQKKQGALSHQAYLKKIFNNAEIINKNKGYYIIKMIKR